ncbi:hypothetical protein [Bacteroides sp.]|uniref:hypothetical protein n=1 Tax=Bacteroides sp. TaxID=29523 RepID=UPI00261E4531|nr:hypothetical protein [Bacteroides sp.]MDD3040922.1 hypothetical protein [Bacteroides sp.]
MKTTNDKPITPQQLKALHATFHAHGMDDEARHECIASFTGGRTASTKYLTMNEARLLLSHLNRENEQVRKMMQQEANAVLRSIYHLSMRISFLNKGFPSDTEDDKQMNLAKINMWCRSRTKYRKTLREMNPEELKAVKKQLEAIVRKEPDNE